MSNFNVKRWRAFAVLFFVAFCLGAATLLHAFQVDVTHLYYSNPNPRLINYDFSTSTVSGNIITIPDTFLQKPPTEAAITYTFGVAPGGIGISSQWSPGQPRRLLTSSNGTAAILPVGENPDALSAKTLWEYRVKFQNFVIDLNNGKTYRTIVGHFYTMHRHEGSVYGFERRTRS